MLESILQKIIGHRSLLLHFIQGIRKEDHYNKAVIRIKKDEISQMVKEIKEAKKQLIKIIDKGGVVVVVNDESIITAYNRDSYRKQK